MDNQSLFIDNKWIYGKGDQFISKNPATGEIIYKKKYADNTQVVCAVKSARNAFLLWSELSFENRCSYILKFIALLTTNRQELAEIISKETGKPLWEAESEVGSMIAKADISIKAYKERTGVKEFVLNDGNAVLRHKPHGVVAVLGPYNFPGHLPNGHIIPALIAGNTVVFKPSSKTPLVAQKTVSLWEQTNLPKGVINLICGDRNSGRLLGENNNVDGLFFTGGIEAGIKFQNQFANNPDKILALEMGGNNPLIISDDLSDIKAAVYNTVISAYISAGQRCSCARRIFVPSGDMGDMFISMLKKSVLKIKIGTYNDTIEPFMGPVISNQSAKMLIKEQENLKKMGGIPVISMKILKEKTGFISPGLMDVTKISNLPDREYFGPFLQLIRFDDFNHAIDMANNTKFGLCAGLFSDSQSLYNQFYNKIRAGVINFNCPLTGASGTLPFGGIGMSGNFRPSAYYAADYCSYPVSSKENKKVTIPEKPVCGVSV